MALPSSPEPPLPPSYPPSGRESPPQSLEVEKIVNILEGVWAALAPELRHETLAHIARKEITIETLLSHPPEGADALLEKLVHAIENHFAQIRATPQEKQRVLRFLYSRLLEELEVLSDDLGEALHRALDNATPPSPPEHPASSKAEAQKGGQPSEQQPTHRAGGQASQETRKEMEESPARSHTTTELEHTITQVKLFAAAAVRMFQDDSPTQTGRPHKRT